MRRVLSVWSFALAVSITQFAKAEPLAHWHYFWYSVKRDAYRNNSWPSPFIEGDRQTVGAPFATMVQNGWRMQNLMTEHHFNSETNELTPAGEVKVRWIMTQAPQQFRTVFVQNGTSGDETSTRVASVEKALAKVAPDLAKSPVQTTDLAPRGYSAEDVYQTYNGFIKAAPAPKLPEAKQEAQ